MFKQAHHLGYFNITVGTELKFCEGAVLVKYGMGNSKAITSFIFISRNVKNIMNPPIIKKQVSD